MAEGTGEKVLMVGVIAAGGYVAWQYFQYSNAINILNQVTVAGGTNYGNAVAAALPFMNYLFGNASTSQQQQALQAINAALAAGSASALQASMSTKAPGTTSSGQTTTTSVSNSPSTTTGTTSTTAASGSAVAQPTATDLQNKINMTQANADQWNYAYRQIMGYGIDQVYGFNFDQVYGPVTSQGVRKSGILSAQAFLNMPQLNGYTTPKTSGISGLGAIAHFYTPVYVPQGSLIYQAQHPSPYRQVGSNFSGFTQPTGMEKAIWAGQTLRSNRIL